MTGFVGARDHADICVVVVTYNSADVIDALIASVRQAAAGLDLRLVVVDNDSADRTCEHVRNRDDVVLVEPGANLGYAGGINAARAYLGPCESILVLNPDLTLDPSALAAMLTVLREQGVGAVVPRLLHTDGATATSIRREPSLASVAVDAVIGSAFPNRPRWSSETVHRLDAYERRHSIDWATGAALLVRKSVADEVGDWDERFFLYSEETDYFRRVRELGWSVVYVPSARAHHHGAGSGTAQNLSDLMAANRIRYIEKYRPRAYSTAFRSGVVLSEFLRSRDAGHRRTLSVVANRSRWESLPRASRRPAQTANMGSIVVPAHDESTVIGRTLEPLSSLAIKGIVDIVVVCNGCSDDTAEVARRVPGVRVLEIEQASKVAALNAGDAVTDIWPRIYLDADIVLTADAAVDVLSALSAGEGLAARPAAVYDTAGASFVVRRYYAARSSMSSFQHALWGAGCYALTEDGHDRLGSFPDVVADDVHVDNLFAAHEKAAVRTEPVIISVPRTAGSLVHVLGRNYRGNSGVDTNTVAERSVLELLRAVRGPVSMFDSAVYVAFALLGRVRARRSSRSTATWERDTSSR